VSGYPLTLHTVRTFHDHDLTDNPTEASRWKKWNKKLSSVRIAIEHAFGRLKGWFPILRDFPAVDMQNTYRTIEALLILHNILETIADDVEELEDYFGRDNLCVVPPRENGGNDGGNGNEATVAGAGGTARRPNTEYAKGLKRRKLLLDL
jgi:hypothetical protein